MEKKFSINHSTTDQPMYIIIDLFCGAGGTTTGFVQALNKKKQIAKVVACINHDHKAILSHWANNPEVKHFEEDIRNLDLTELVQLVKFYRKQYQNAYLILWASLECTNFSNAKGGLARDADSRTLAYSLNRVWNEKLNDYIDGDSYIQLLDPDYIQIENVREFKQWGLSRIKMRNGKPVKIKNKHGEIVFGYEDIPNTKGQEFDKWRESVKELGYNDEWRMINSADVGEFTSRNRLFGMFSKPGLKPVWPKLTHSKDGKDGKKVWKAVKEKIDFSDQGHSILHRSQNMAIPKRYRKDLSENTLERVYAGCIKHIAGGHKEFMIKYHGGKPRTNNLDKPLTVIDTQNRHAVVQAFVASYHGNGDNTASMNNPHPTIPAADICAAVFINRTYSGGGNSSSIESPLGSLPTVPKANLVTAQQLSFIDSSHYTNTPQSIQQPLRTITANRKYPYVFNLQYGGQMKDVSKPCPTIVATSNKTPWYLLMTETGEYSMQIFETDSPATKKIKEFMAIYEIVDIKMRMLRVDELLTIQGFPKGYRLTGSQEDQKKFIGNSVVPGVVKAWCEAMGKKYVPRTLYLQNIKKAA